jgi:hypothetical protein
MDIFNVLKKKIENDIFFNYYEKLICIKNLFLVEKVFTRNMIKNIIKRCGYPINGLTQSFKPVFRNDVVKKCTISGKFEMEEVIIKFYEINSKNKEDIEKDKNEKVIEIINTKKEVIENNCNNVFDVDKKNNCNNIFDDNCNLRIETGYEEILMYKNIRLNKNDYERTFEGKWFSDDLVDFYIT